MKEYKFNKILERYSDTLWVYDLHKEQIYIYHDTLFPDMVGHWYDPDELTTLYEGHLFKADLDVWEQYLTKEALNSFGDADTEHAEFELRFKFEGTIPRWYHVHLDRLNDHQLSISDRNIYNDIKEMSLRSTAENVFDNIFYVDIESKNYIIHLANPVVTPPGECVDYEVMMERFIRLYTVEEEMEMLIERTKLAHVIRMLEKRDIYTIYVTLHNKKGQLEYKKLVFSYLDDSKKILTLVRLDVSDLVSEYEHKLRQYKNASYRDSLTGAYNRKYFDDKMKNLTLDAGVAVIDVDDFKLCNDMFGHAVGDEALTAIVHTIHTNISKHDLLIRSGGDEFFLVIPRITEEALNEKLKQIQWRASEIVLPQHPEVRLSISVGGVLMHGNTFEEAINQADRLMYQAKNQKNMVVTPNAAGRRNGQDSERFNPEEMKQQVLIVDDSEINREILASMLSDDFEILMATNGKECIDMIREHGTAISIILLDIIMPVMDGFEVLSYMNRHGLIDDIPIVMISGADSDSYIRQAYSLGASDYISRPFDSKVVYRRVFNIIKLYSKQRRLISIVSEQAREKEKNNRMMIDIFSQIVEFRNGESGMHVLRVNTLTAMILESLLKKTDRYNLSWADCSFIATASALHDIGKMRIDPAILNKKGKLTDEEFEIMKTHTILGAEMLEELDMYKNEKLVKTAIEICRWHHERYDGNGYPDGLKGDEIPISAQVVALADVYDALVSKRVYKEVYAHDKAVQMIFDGECGSFNPILLECFEELSDRIQHEISEQKVWR